MEDGQAEPPAQCLEHHDGLRQVSGGQKLQDASSLQMEPLVSERFSVASGEISGGEVLAERDVPLGGDGTAG